MLALAIPGIPSSDHAQQASQATSFSLSPSFLCLILKYAQIRNDHQVVKQSPHDEKESPPKQKRNSGENPEKQETEETAESFKKPVVRCHGKVQKAIPPIKKEGVMGKEQA